MSSQKRIHLLLLSTLFLLGFALRLFRIENQSLWWDEGISLHLATSTWGGILADRVQNIHPPGYFFLLKLWVSLVGQTPFAVRYSSALVSLVQVAAVYATVRLFFGERARHAALMGGLLVTLSPLSIVYAQETRVYALLPLIYFGLIAASYRLVTINSPGWRRWLPFGGVIWLGLHLHYITAFMILTCGMWVLLVKAQRRDWRQVRALFVSAAAVLFASLPWFVPVIFNQLTSVSDTRSGTFLAEPVPRGFLFSQIWLFHLTGLAGALQFDGLIWSGAAVGVLLLLLLGISLLWRSGRTPTAIWFALWFLPLLASMYMWSIRSFSHPRYVSMFALGLFPLLAWLVARPLQDLSSVWQRVYRGAAAALLIALLTISAQALFHYYFNPAVEKDDMRGVARFLEIVAQPDDLIIIPDTDHSLRFEYRGETPVVMPDLTQRVDLAARFGAWMSGQGRIFVVDYDRGTRDWQNFVHFALNNGGVLMAQTEFEDLRLDQYAVDSPYAAPTLQPLGAPMRIEGGMTLLDAWVEPVGNATGAVSVMLNWRIDTPPPHRVQGALRLLGRDGALLSQQSIQLIDPNGRPPDAWRGGAPIVTVHTLSIPEGTPPLPQVVTLELFVQNENGLLTTVPFLTPNPQSELYLGETRLQRTTNISPLQPQPVPHLDATIHIDPALELVGYRLDRSVLLAGQSLLIDLLWRAAQEELPLLEPAVELVGDRGVETVVPESFVLQHHPTTQWEAGELVWERRAVVVPASAAGETSIVLRLGDVSVTLGTVQVEATKRVFTEPPVETKIDVTLGDFARLVGVDIGERTEAGVPLRLVWRAVGESTLSYKLFLHLLGDDGRIVGQVDAYPQDGQRPTSGWVKDEYLVETFIVPFNDPAFSGEYRIAVGFYEPTSGVRLLTATGSDAIILP